MRSEKSDLWSFEEPPDCAVITLVSIVRQGKPVLYARNDADGWQFLDGEDVRIEDAMVIGLGEMIQLDRSLLALADLPTDWCAWRDTPEEPWHRSPMPTEAA